MPIDDAAKYHEPIDPKRQRLPSGIYNDPIERRRKSEKKAVRKKPKKHYYGLLGNGSKKVTSVF